MSNAIFSLYTLGCSSCSGTLEKSLRKVRGISEVDVNYVADMAEIKFDPAIVTSEEIRAFMKKLGYAAGERHAPI